jgi:hypothetical protein
MDAHQAKGRAGEYVWIAITVGLFLCLLAGLIWVIIWLPYRLIFKYVIDTYNSLIEASLPGGYLLLTAIISGFSVFIWIYLKRSDISGKMAEKSTSSKLSDGYLLRRMHAQIKELKLNIEELTKTGLSSDRLTDEIRQQINISIKNEVTGALLEELEELKKCTLGIDNQIQNERISDVISKSIRSQITGEFVSAIENKYSKAAFDLEKQKGIDEIYLSIKDRSEELVISLSVRAKVNLFIGMLITFAGVLMLLYFVLQQHTTFLDVYGLLSHYLPRLGVVSLVEIFSYFFLKLYKANLEDVKYYQNELTTIQEIMLSIKSAVAYSDKKALNITLEALAKTDRNLALSKASKEAPKLILPKGLDVSALIRLIQSSVTPYKDSIRARPRVKIKHGG